MRSPQLLSLVLASLHYLLSSLLANLLTNSELGDPREATSDSSPDQHTRSPFDQHIRSPFIFTPTTRANPSELTTGNIDFILQHQTVSSVSILRDPASTMTNSSSLSSTLPSHTGAASRGTNPGVVAAVVPIVVVVLFLFVGAVWICRRRKARKAEASSWREIDDISSNHLTEVSYGTRSWFWGSERTGSAAETSASQHSNPNIRALVAALFTHRPATSMSQNPATDPEAGRDSEKHNPDVPVDGTAEGSILQTNQILFIEAFSSASGLSSSQGVVCKGHKSVKEGAPDYDVAVASMRQQQDRERTVSDTRDSSRPFFNSFFNPASNTIAFESQPASGTIYEVIPVLYPFEAVCAGHFESLPHRRQEDSSCDPFEDSFCDPCAGQDICFTETETVIMRTIGNGNERPTTQITSTNPPASPTVPSNPTSTPPQPPLSTSQSPTSATTSQTGAPPTTTSTSTDTLASSVSSSGVDASSTTSASSSGVAVTVTSVSVTSLPGSVLTATETFVGSLPGSELSSPATTSSTALPAPVPISASKGTPPAETATITAVCVFFFAFSLFSAWYWSRKRARRRLEADNAVRTFDSENMVEAPECERSQSRSADTASMGDTGSHAPLLHSSTPDLSDTASSVPQPPQTDLPSSPAVPTGGDAVADEKAEGPDHAGMSAGSDQLADSSEAPEVLSDPEHGHPARIPPLREDTNIIPPTVIHSPDHGALSRSPSMPMDYWTVMAVYATDDEMLLPPPAYSRT
ncbi:hypothetical protein L226DRAFT_522265 [Lentinus tigrinus ALCF2SS1-7]|uniref:Uncharacterized protein n=1 Tax=Lentinus tigrinus ALCF2SS1-6 TaxID=1328759 RepID=A0A5C2S9K8_9APHY|nr:hypothetical protein L227DRAFT_563391 [Lentinus tigrinus ALCF2SS1-6]RPD75756.1 hypothetical protein L226DRAFT_522265 [Lentinus tigrinus ALCF2SS1-7]